jgi:serine/threonine-protein kinase
MSQPESPSKPTSNDTHQWALEPVRDLSGKVLGDFRVERLLGHGGMGEVYLARQVSLDRPVALKVLRSDLLSNPTYLARFESEAWAAAKLSHPNIVHIYTIGTIDGIRYIAMEYVQGTNLREYLSKKGIPGLDLALSIMRQAGLAIGAAGEVGLVHRDIKPENLLLTKKGQVKIADFGLVRAPETEKLHLTQPGVTLGTPLYMSPEQAQGHALDHRSDLYSLGITFYHMLAGFPPFRADTGLALALKHVREKPVNLSVHRPDLPPELVKLVMRLMAKKPAERYQSAQEMLRDVAKVREAVQASAAATAANQTTQPATDAVEVPIEPKSGSSAEQTQAWTRPIAPSAGTIVLVSIATLLLGALLGWTTRAQDLLSPSAPNPGGPPGLWLGDWKAIERQPSPRAQYRHALLKAPAVDREAAWLAVSGYFRGSEAREWTSRASTQLARSLFRHRDAESLDVLGGELSRSAHTHDKTLANLVKAAGAVLDGEADDAAELLGQTPKLETMDPADLELMLEITLGAERVRPDPGPQVMRALRSLQRDLIRVLQVDLPEAVNRPAAG